MPARLQVVMGKGGVGKTTLAAALALAHAGRGHKVGLVSLAGGSDAADLLQAAGDLPPGLDLLDLDPRNILDDAMRGLVPFPALAQLLTSHPAYDALLRIVPGVRELALLHRLVDLTEGTHDAIVVDGLSTGHGTHFLEAPRKSAHLLAGVLADRARAIDATLTDPERTEVVLASTLEEMPVREAVALAAALRERGFRVRAVVANRVTEPRLRSPDATALLERLAERDLARDVASETGASWMAVRRMARASLHMERRARAKAPRLEELRAIGLPLLEVPLEHREAERLRVASERLAGLAEAVP